MERDTASTRRCMMRRGLGLVAGTAIAASGVALTGTARAQDAKVAKNLVQYQDTPKDGGECDKCVNWVAPNACKIVEGPIAPKGWCVAFAPQG